MLEYHERIRVSEQWRQLLYLVLLVMASLLNLSSPVYAQPRLETVLPGAVQQGQEVELTLTGSQLSNPHTLLAYRKGFEVLELTPVDANKVLAKCRVADDCQPGLLALRLCGQAGISTLRTITVSPLPVIAEQEPVDAEKPQLVTLPTTISGIIAAEDVDAFCFEVEKGGRISAEMEGVRLGNQFYDPCLELRGPDGKTIAFVDDTVLTRQDPWLSITAPIAGRYRLVVRERAGGGSPACHYALHIGPFPRPSVTFPGGGQPGETVKLSFPAQPGIPATEVSLPAQPVPKHDWFYADEQGQVPSALLLHVSPHANSVEQEPNQPRERANVIPTPSVVCGVVDSPDDHDLFRFAAKAGEVWTFRSVSRSIMRSPIDLVLRLHEANGKYLASNDDMGGPDSYLEYTIPADGDYMLEIIDLLGRGGSDFVYRIIVDRPTVATSLTIPPRAVNVSTTVTVPQGNRMAALVTATRRTHNTDVNLKCVELPAGVTCEAQTIPRDRDRVPVVFRAAPEAAVGAALVDLQGESLVGDVRVLSTFQQRTPLAVGENNQDMWGHDADRLALSVNPSSPFELVLDPQPDPVVRNGEKQLTVRVVRPEGFTAPVQVQMLYCPPGISAPGNVTIPDGAIEVPLTITANASAALGTWPIALIGQATVEGVRHEVSTDVVPLQIADNYFEITFKKGRIQRGASGEMIVEVNRKSEIQGPVEVALVGLPAGVTAPPVKLEPDQSRVSFQVAANEQARPGSYRTILCRLRLDGKESPIVQTLGTGQLRVDP